MQHQRALRCAYRWRRRGVWRRCGASAAMPGGFNYSRWDKLELSDDEDTHPGAQFIEKNTLRRIKRESHEIHEAERQAKVDALQAAQAKGASRRRAARAQLRGT